MRLVKQALKNFSATVVFILMGHTPGAAETGGSWVCDGFSGPEITIEEGPFFSTIRVDTEPPIEYNAWFNLSGLTRVWTFGQDFKFEFHLRPDGRGAVLRFYRCRS